MSNNGHLDRPAWTISDSLSKPDPPLSVNDPQQSLEKTTHWHQMRKDDPLLQSGVLDARPIPVEEVVSSSPNPRHNRHELQQPYGQLCEGGPSLCASLDDPYVLVAPLITPSDPLPQHPAWPDWTPLTGEEGPHIHMDEALCVAVHRIPQDRIPPGWSNDFERYFYHTGEWNAFYGGIQWHINECFHIPGEARLLLVSADWSNPQEYDHHSLQELIEVEGGYIFRDPVNNAIFVPEGDPSLDEILDCLPHRVADLHLRARELDEASQLTYGAWGSRASVRRANLRGGDLLY